MLVAGASVRAAVESARRAGLETVAADLFADLDLRRLAPVRRFERYPEDLPRLLDALRPAAWMYTGALENFPDLLERLDGGFRLLGNPPAVLRKVRDPWTLAAACREAGWRVPEIRRLTGDPPSGAWLLKPFRSANGSGVRRWDALSQPSRRAFRARARRTTAAGYLQRLVPGRCYGASFVADGRRCLLLGVCRQLCGVSWLSAGGFRYCGSIGPLELPGAMRQSLERLGGTLSAAFALRGLFGVDFVDGSEGPFVLEVNPRYTSSMELLDRILPQPAVRLHVDACLEGRLPVDVSGRHVPSQDFLTRDSSPRDDSPCHDALFGKGILYARRASRVTGHFLRWATARHPGRRFARVADIPAPDWPLQPGAPITTLLARGGDEAEVLRRLRRLAGCARRLLDQ